MDADQVDSGFPWTVTRTLRRVTVSVLEVCDLKDQLSHPRSKLWYTLCASSPANTSSHAMGKLESRKTRCAEPVFHEMLVDISLVPSLVFKLKKSSSFLFRNVTVGTHQIDLAGGQDFSGFAKLVNRSGSIVGQVRLEFQTSQTSFPAMHFAPQPFWMGSKQMTRQYCTLACDGSSASLEDSHVADYSQGANNVVRVQAQSYRVISRQNGDVWRIIEQRPLSCLTADVASDPGRKFELSCQHDVCGVDSPLHFSLEQSDGCGEEQAPVSLVPGNVLDPTDQDKWGVWSLVRSDVALDLATGEGFLALLHLVGASVECSAANEAALALAVINAMLWASLQHSPSLRALQRLIATTAAQPVVTATPLGTAHNGPGFFVLSHAQVPSSSGSEAPATPVPVGGPGPASTLSGYASRWLALRVLLASQGRGAALEAERTVHTFLRGQSGAFKSAPVLGRQHARQRVQGFGAAS